MVQVHVHVLTGAAAIAALVSVSGLSPEVVVSSDTCVLVGVVSCMPVGVVSCVLVVGVVSWQDMAWRSSVMLCRTSSTISVVTEPDAATAAALASSVAGASGMSGSETAMGELSASAWSATGEEDLIVDAV